MITQMFNPNQFHQRARQIRARAPVILSQWGLQPRFIRWRLTQDPETGLVVLFGVLNDKYIASNSATPLSGYFDPRLLRDLANDLHVQIMSSNSDGPRYAFILDPGSLDGASTPIDLPFLDGDRLQVAIFYSDRAGSLTPHRLPASLPDLELIADHTHVSRGAGPVLRVFEEIELKGEAVPGRSAQALPAEVTVIDEQGFNQRLTEHEADLQMSKRIRKLFEQAAELE